MPSANTVSLYRTVSHLYRLRWRLKKQAQYIKAYLPPLLAALEAGQDKKFSPGSIRRIIKYWQLSLNIICNSLYRLTGKKLSSAEQHRIILLSIFGPLYDDLFDNGILTYDQIEAFTLAPEKHVPGSFEEHVVKKVYLELLETAPGRETVIRHLHDVFVWQKASLRQMSDTIGEDELYQITYKKSYYSILLYYAVLDHYPGAEVREMLYPMAGLLQLTNDAFDVYKDVHNGIYTLPNLYRNFDQLQQLFMADVALFNRQLQQLPYRRSHKRRYSITIHALHAMGSIALEQLKTVTRQVSSLGELAMLSRKELVCDMDNLPRKVKWVKTVKQLVNHV
jgi:hypothetical protein